MNSSIDYDPFTVDSLTEMFLRSPDQVDFILTDRQMAPSRRAIETLTGLLDTAHRAYNWSKEQKDANARLNNIVVAMEVLDAFFDERENECEIYKLSPKIRLDERELYDKFVRFRDALTTHALLLPTDGPNPLMADIKNWHDVADSVLAAFRIAMRSTNPYLHFGTYAQGPATRFLEQTLPRITGERITKEAINQYFKRKKRQNRQE